MKIPFKQINQIHENIINQAQIAEIKERYNEFVRKLACLMKIFNVTDPIQVQSMFSYMLYKGYLSTGKEFTFANSQITEIENIRGLPVMLGRACCRHIAPLLSDVLKHLDTDAGNLGVMINGSKINITLIPEKKYSIDELIDIVIQHVFEPVERESYITILKKIYEMGRFAEISFSALPDTNPITRTISHIIGNHVITTAYKSGRLDFLDPTTVRVYQPKDIEKRILFDHQLGEIYRPFIPLFSSNSEQNHIWDLARNTKVLATEEIQRLTLETQELCASSTEQFEDFYNENSPLIAEVAQKVLRLERK